MTICFSCKKEPKKDSYGYLGTVYCAKCWKKLKKEVFK